MTGELTTVFPKQIPAETTTKTTKLICEISLNPFPVIVTLYGLTVNFLAASGLSMSNAQETEDIMMR